MSEIQRCELMRANGGEHCAHIELGQPCCQSGYIRPVNHLAEVQRLQEQVRVLRDMAITTRTGVLLMVPEPQKSGFLKIISEALAQTAPGGQR